jgi:glycosyltransferase involved in cell wall biosynthesis
VRILWFGDLAATGFGTVTSDTGRELMALGVDVRFVSQNDFLDLPPEFAERTLDVTTFDLSDAGINGVRDFIPDVVLGKPGPYKLANGEPWGDWKPDAVFLLGDFYGMRLMAEPYLDAFAQVPSFHYVPVEGHDLPPLWKKAWEVIAPIAMSKFGQDEIEKVMGYRPPMVYHGVDSEAFYPVSPSRPIVLDEDGKKIVLTSKAACKVFLMGRADATFVLRTDRNMPRKGYPALLRAMAPVLRDRPMTVLGLHTRRWDQGGLLDDSISKHPDVASRIWTPDFGPVPREILLVMYNAADLYVSVSAEGFGLTIAEAVACGVPAVGLDYSAVPEVIGPAGSVVPVGKYHDNEYGHHWALPDEEAFGKAVAYLLDHPHRRVELGRRGPAHVAKNFRWDVAAERFVQIASQRLHNAPGRAIAQPDVSERELVAA